MKNQPLVTIITRTKDREVFLERAINSVLSQTFQDYEMVIVNDGGNEKTLDKLVTKYSKESRGRIRVINYAESLGAEGVWARANQGIRKSNSKYVVVFDDDDSWHKNFLKKTTEHLEKTGHMGVITQSDLIHERIEGSKIETIRREILFPSLRFINLYKMCFENFAWPASFLYNRNIFEDIGYYDEGMSGFGDWDFGLRFLVQYDIDYLYSEGSLSYYHQRPQASGVYQNSVFSDNQQRLENLMTNKYLRQDIKAGKFGLGYLINSVRKNQFDHDGLLRSIESTSVNQVDKITNIIEENNRKQEKILKDIYARQLTGRVYYKVRSMGRGKKSKQ
jgi:glycosyltransferase involved in cell wall biosynthesis